jgi:hypothetical protein
LLIVSDKNQFTPEPISWSGGDVKSVLLLLTPLKSHGAYTGRAELPDAEKIEMYNAQARRFNECTRNLVDSNNADIDRVRDEANANIQRIADSAIGQIAAIHKKIQWATNGVALDGRTNPEMSATSFPDPQCRKPDDSLLRPVSRNNSNRSNSSLTRGEQYYRQEQVYESCVRDYVERASAETNQIESSANSEIRRVADIANSRIVNLQAVVRTGIETANSAALAKSQMVEGTPLARNDPILRARSAENPLEDAKADPKLWPVIQGTPTGEGDRRVITCRAPQQLPDSHLLGPEVCRRNGVWAALRKAGEDVGPDGKTILSFDGVQKMNPAACSKTMTGLGTGQESAYVNNEFCN